MLHDVEDETRFRQCVQWLLERYRIVPLSDLITDCAPAHERRLALTFDDGYADWHEVAAPVLEALSCPATFFVCSGFVGLQGTEASTFRADRLRRSRDLAPLTTAQLQDLSASSLFEIGSHTVSHVDLGGVWSDDVFATEIDADRKRLEDWSGSRVGWFAYPFGEPHNVPTAAVDHVRRAGFDGACTAWPGTLDTVNDPFLLPRQSIDMSTAPLLWSARLDGGYDLVFAAKRYLPGTSGRVKTTT